MRAFFYGIVVAVSLRSLCLLWPLQCILQNTVLRKTVKIINPKNWRSIASDFNSLTLSEVDPGVFNSSCVATSLESSAFSDLLSLETFALGSRERLPGFCGMCTDCCSTTLLGGIYGMYVGHGAGIMLGFWFPKYV